MRFVISLIYNYLNYSIGVGDNLGDVRHRKRCSILEEKRNQTCPISVSSIKLALILTRNKFSKLKNFEKYFDPAVNNRAEFPNRRIVIYLVCIYLCSSVGVGNRLRDGQHRKGCSIIDQATKTSPFLEGSRQDVRVTN